MTRKHFKKTACLVLTAAVFVSGIVYNAPSAAGKAKLKKKSMTMTVGQKEDIVIKGQKGKAKYSFKSSSKKIATVSKKGRVTAKKAGKATITVKEKYKNRNKKIGTVKIKVKDKPVKKSPKPSAAVPSSAPVSSAPASMSSAPVASTAPETTQSTAPSNSPKPTTLDVQPDPDGRGLDDGKGLDVPSNFKKVDSSVAGKVVQIKYDSTVIKEGEKVERTAQVVLPKDYSTDKKYPVLYMNHGIGGHGSDFVGANVQNVIWNASASGVTKDMIAVFPDCCANEANGTGTGEGALPFLSVEHYQGYNNFLNDLEQCLMPYMKEHYSILEGRENTAICGFSMGGRVTLHIGFSLPDKFGYIGAFCPAPGIFTHNDNGVHETGLFTKESFTLPDQYKGFDKTLVMIVKGTTDSVVKQFPQDYSDGLYANGVPHIYYKKKGGHDENVYKHGLYNFLKRIFQK